MHRKDPTNKQKEEETAGNASDAPNASKTDQKVLRFLERARDIAAELDEINAALEQPYIDNLDQIQVGIETLSSVLLELNDEVNAVKEHKLVTAKQQLLEVKALIQSTAQNVQTANEKMTTARDQGKDVEWDDESDEDEFVLPPLSSLTPIHRELTDDYFFAHNLAEYEARRDEIKPLHDDFAAAADRISSLTLQTKGLKKSAASEQSRLTLINKLDAELLMMNHYKGFLDDLIRRHQGINNHNRNVRDFDFIDRPELSPGQTEESQVRAISARVALINQHVTELNAAKVRANKEKAITPLKNVFYSALNQHQVFAEADNAANVNNATNAAYHFLKARLQQNQAWQPDMLRNAVGVDKKFTTANHTCRFIGTEVATTPGKPAIPVAVIQETNKTQTYSEQKMLLVPGDLKKLNSLPFSTSGKVEKIKQQMLFVAQLIETSLASIKTNGPVRIDNWPDNLTRAAAVYCEHMGYELSPKQCRNNIKSEQMTTLLSGFKAQIEDNADLKQLVKEATARRDLKAPAEAPRPR